MYVAIFFASIHSKDTRFCIGISELMIEFFLCIYTGCIDLSRKRKYEAEMSNLLL